MKFPIRQHAKLAPIIAGLLSLGIYLSTLAPTVTSEDSGELIAAAYSFGVPHPPGYPIWTILCGLFIRIVPFGEVAWRSNLFSAVSAATAIGILCSGLMLLRIGHMIAFSTSLVIAFGAVFWSQSVITEVYTLHALFFVLLFWLTLKWFVSNESKWLIIAAVTLGLALCNHHTIGLSGVGIAVWVLVRRPQLLRAHRLQLACLGVFTLGLTPYLYLPARAAQNPSMNWGNPDTWETFVRHVSRKQYKSPEPPPVLPWRERLQDDSRQATQIALYCKEEQTPWLLAIGAIGIVGMASQRKTLLLLFLSLTAVHTALFLYLHGIGPSRQDIWSSKVFFLPQYMLMALPIGLGLEFITRVFRDRIHNAKTRRWLGKAAICAVLLLPTLPLLRHWPDNNLHNYWYANDHGRNILASTLPEAIIFPSGDHSTFPLIYLTQVEGLRPDVTIADKYGYIEPKLYLDMPEFHGRRPRCPEERDQIEEWIVRRAKRPVFYTVKQRSVVPNASLVPVGVAYHLLPDSKQIDQSVFWEQIAYRNLTDGRTAPLDHGAANILADYEFFRGVRKLELGSSDEAVECFRAAAKYAAGIKEVHNNIGCALAEYGLIDQAYEYYQSAAAMDSDYGSARWNLARLYKSERRWKEAERVFLELVESTPDDYRVFGELGYLGELNSVPPNVIVARFQESLRLNPAQAQIIKHLADHYYSSHTDESQEKQAAHGKSDHDVGDPTKVSDAGSELSMNDSVAQAP